MLGRDFLGDLQHQAVCVGQRRLELQLEPLRQAAVQHALARQSHEQRIGLALANEGQRRTEHPAVDVLEQIVARRGGHELGWQYFLALRIEHADRDVEHLFIAAGQRRDRLLHQSEAVFHQCRLDVAHPDLVVGLNARVVVGTIDRGHLAAAVLAGAAQRLERVHDGAVEIRLGERHDPEADAAGRPQAVAGGLEQVLGHAIDQALAPRFHVAWVAALKQHQQRGAAEVPGNVVRAEQ